MDFDVDRTLALREAIVAVLDQQLRDTTMPPATRRTDERLVALEYALEDTRRLIGNVVAHHGCWSAAGGSV